ncbi:hypothetical protein [Marinospirillum insulare]|uniref:Uncharacterized protein n=1 Tax=Marinospirillum insulare TaxID=217169 RepID=A0ABQ5ZWN4_9GAMM|nr:hypothetical protein [Marinospirillum insulare]GLR62782.1 hypothetical protein GCM10007878_02170 [Marinospirillum insulare]
MAAQMDQNFFKAFVTEFNDTISGETYLDPLGQLVIWSTYGQQIFDGRVSSVSNDVRNYTLNLLHHGVIRHLQRDETFHADWKDSLQFVHACLIYLENLATYALVSSTDHQVQTEGILGNSKARTNLDKKDKKLELIFNGNMKVDEDLLLVRQLGLGVSGRYKTPFVKMGFFNSSYSYTGPKADHRWSEFHRLLDKKTQLKSCFEKAVQHLKELVPLEKNTKQLRWAEVPEDLKQAYREVFKTSQNVGKISRDFWLSVTGLNKGAAKAIAQAIAEIPKENGSVKPQEIFRLAQKKLVSNANEKEKIDSILTIEPFLTKLDLLFRVAQQKKTQTLDEIETSWEKLEQSDKTLPEMASVIEATSAIQEPLNATGKYRLSKLLSAAKQPSVASQLEALLDYHAEIMRQRGQLPWLRLEQSKVVNDGRTSNLPDKGKASEWVNAYYLREFHHLLTGLGDGL